MSREEFSLGGLGNLAPANDRSQLIHPAQPDRYQYAARRLEEAQGNSGYLTLNGHRRKVDFKELKNIGYIGHGSCGTVEKYEYEGVIMAVKAMPITQNSYEVSRIMMDLTVICRSFDCPYIVKCYGYFITNQNVYVCMECMATCLDRLLKLIQQPIPENIIGVLCVSIVKALHYLKHTHIMHRDVKPSNILLDWNGTIKLCDFGIAGQLIESRAHSRQAGCPLYMGPERLDPNNQDSYDIRSDVWSFGLTLVELATGKYPFPGNEFEMMMSIINDDPPRLKPSDGFTPMFCNLVEQCLQKKPENRPNYDELLEHPFLEHYQNTSIDVEGWFSDVMEGWETKEAQETKLSDQFTTSLQQQIKMLQIENAFLRNQTNTENECKIQSNVPHHRSVNEISVNAGETWCQLPPFHPPVHALIPEKAAQRFKRFSHEVPEVRNFRDHSMPRSTTNSLRDKSSSFIVSESDLLVDLEQNERKNAVLERQLRHSKQREQDQEKVINSLSAKIKELEEKNQQLTGYANTEKRALMEEVLELQKRIDEMTPAIAEKEMKIAQIENERAEIANKLRNANVEQSNLQIEISQLREDISIKNNKLKRMGDDAKLLESKIQSLERTIDDLKIREAKCLDEISHYSEKVRELELICVNDKRLIDQAKEENTLLIKENAKISTKLSHFEKKETETVRVEKREVIHSDEEFEEMRRALESEQSNVVSLNAKLEIFKQRCNDLQMALSEHELIDEQQASERRRVEKELNALHALSKSLSSENKILREDKLATDEIISDLKLKVKTLENNAKASEELFLEKKKMHAAKILELEEEALRKHQKYLEFEELSKTLHQITSLLPSKTSSMTYECKK
ncbi:unnamed protein product [Caenorhabditis bovis]|uniref:mitogen-activated protein kinase kinase n=1 Tax=Caenorhabditis bovis TaxID=2654633 RepID=A0A8S1EF35_9PELO|nr:unnamed protein product [Caenorhabditis bovis]